MPEERFPKELGDKILFEAEIETRDHLFHLLEYQGLISREQVEELQDVSYRFRRKKQQNTRYLEHRKDQLQEDRQRWTEHLQS
ncbi:hypothetical protein [Natronosalvus hydrolyticus]|uniref:hypothetical protein n=1 Tax=Natronosalvus hydrolyticus TaxID=2979988 RepID=UPI00319E1099